MPIAGLDLAGVESKPTGFCALADMKAETSLVYADSEILSKIRESNPQVIAIDAPLSLPPGRKFLEELTGAHLTSRQGFNLNQTEAIRLIILHSFIIACLIEAYLEKAV